VFPLGLILSIATGNWTWFLGIDVLWTPALFVLVGGFEGLRSLFCAKGGPQAVRAEPRRFDLDLADPLRLHEDADAVQNAFGTRFIVDGNAASCSPPSPGGAEGTDPGEAGDRATRGQRPKV